jgi:hypothetical protein
MAIAAFTLARLTEAGVGAAVDGGLTYPSVLDRGDKATA